MTRSDHPLARLLLRNETLTVTLTVLVVIVATLVSPRFADPGFLLLSATFFAEYGLVALFMTMLIIGGEIDLSVASQIALTACVFGVLQESGLHIPLAVALTMGLGLVLGMVNAVAIVRFGLPALIATIGTLTLYRGLAQVLLGDRSVTRFPDWWYGIDYLTFLGLPLSIVIFLCATALAALVLHGSRIGRAIFQIGVNASAARRVGINTDVVRFGLYMATGLACALAGLMMSSRLGSVRYDLATGGELQIVVIAVLGGAAITGGVGSIFGAFTAFWLLVLIQTAMMLENVGAEIQLAVVGALLILALAIPHLITTLANRRNLVKALDKLDEAQNAQMRREAPQ